MMCVRFIVFIWCAVRFEYSFGANDIHQTLTEKFTWQSIEYAWPSDSIKQDALQNGNYVPENNLPASLAIHDTKLFIGMPRLKLGVASSLNYINLTDAANEKSPKLIPYPDWRTNLIKNDHQNLTNSSASEGSVASYARRIDNSDAIVSTSQIYIDECSRLWVLDTGLINILDNPQQIAPPKLVIYDLKTDKLIRQCPLNEKHTRRNSFFANLIVDISHACGDAYAYIADSGSYGLIVYSYNSNKFWRIKHNFFHIDPMNGNFNAGGVNFILNHGIYGMALGQPDQHNYRKVYFHALSSTKEFFVPSYVLRNEKRATNPNSYYDYTYLGCRGSSNGQSSVELFDKTTNVLFYAKVSKNAIGCWRTDKTYAADTQGSIELPSYPIDMKIDKNATMWVLSNRLPAFLNNSMSLQQFNYHIFVGSSSEVIKGTPCDPNANTKQKQ